jgi:aspartyl-tRNA(Asn)/glutamyl-tRNA(Gln) amidotransferase subunit C
MLAFAMPARFSSDEVAAIAALANLDLDASELELFARQLGEILSHVEEIQAIDTTGVPPTTSVVTGHTSDRRDEVRPSLDRREVLAHAPDAAIDAGFFRVPRVLG